MEFRIKILKRKVFKEFGTVIHPLKVIKWRRGIKLAEKDITRTQFKRQRCQGRKLIYLLLTFAFQGIARLCYPIASVAPRRGTNVFPWQLIVSPTAAYGPIWNL